LRLWDLMRGLKFWMMIQSSSPHKKICSKNSLRWSDLSSCFWKHLIYIMFTTCFPSCWNLFSNL
jgi:hypothetical protein